MRRALPLAAALAAALLLPPALSAQSATLEVRVIDAVTRQPLNGAQVVLTGWRRVITDAGGTARLTGVPAGSQTIEAAMLGYEPRAVLVRVGAEGAVAQTVELTPKPIELAGVSAQSRMERRSPRLEAFYRRARNGVGQYFTRDDIEAMNAQSLSEILHMVPNLVMISTPIGERPRLQGVTPELVGTVNKPAGDCPILYFIDGVPFEPSHQGVISLDLSVAEVEGIEIYRRGSAVPVQYKRGNDSCGVILIWKRERAG